MSIKPLSKYLSIILLSIAFVSIVYSQEAKLMKSIVDTKTGITFNNFRTDSLETIFYKVKIDNGLVYDSPKNNAELKYSLNINSIVEYLELGPKKKFVKIRLIDSPSNVVEGWVRKKTISRMKYYGRSFLSFTQDSSEKNNIDNNLIDPRWIKTSDSKVFLEENLSGNEVTILAKGDLVFVDSLFVNSLFNDTAKIKYRNNEGGFITGFIKSEVLSTFAMIDNPKTDFDVLLKDINPLVFMYNLNKSGFISYSGLLISNDLKKNINEDKVCREIGADSLLYKFTFSDDIKNIVKKYESKSNPSRHNFAMFRKLPNKKIITRADTIDCQVIEIVHRPKTASITSNNIEKTDITNKISKFYVHHLDKFDMDIVFQKETNEYHWSYKKNLENGEYIEHKYKPTKIIQRVIAFRKHDVEK
ncbi:MAG: hypothetical protein PF574_03670 [Candidatus Delongbacteria bacterium]|jgi:hypothetical protein|nr:hypothetical protein [Candidatus Delongbacteria bacterium]